MLRSPSSSSYYYKGRLLVSPFSTASLPQIRGDSDDKNEQEKQQKTWQVKQLMQALTALHRPSLSAHQVLHQGRLLHDIILTHTHETQLCLINNLVSIYASCGFLSEASHLFTRLRKRNVVSWTTMIASVAQSGYGATAFDYFRNMLDESIKPNHVTYVSLLTACSNPDFTSRGNLIYFLLVETGYDSHVVSATALIKMYCNCSTLDNAYYIFQALFVKDIVTWTIMIAAYVRHEIFAVAFVLFEQMQLEGMLLNEYTYNILINACATMPTIEEGERIHTRVVDTKFEQCLFIRNALLDMYAKCGSLEIAHKIFMIMPKRDLVSWNALINAFAQHGNVIEVFNYFQKMKHEGLKPDRFTYSCILSVCTSSSDLPLGKGIHKEVRDAGLESELAVVNALLDMYAKCGCMDEAHALFNRMAARNVISWTTMVAGCTRQTSEKEALEMFGRMPKRDVFSWTAMIQGYVQHENHIDALDCFLEMQGEGVWPNHITFGTVIGACAGLLDVEKGRELHMNIVEDGYVGDQNVRNALVDMYARCGSLSDACHVFERMPKRDAVSWNVMIGGFAEHGHGKEAFEVSQQMQIARVKPDEFTISCVLTACRHAGLISEASYYFNHVLRSENNIKIAVQHYASVIDLLGRAGCLMEAEEFINRIPFQPNVVVLMSILSACKSHGDINLAQRFTNHVLSLAPTNAAAHILLSNIFKDGPESWVDEEELDGMLLEVGD